jgi:hypothetical protein
MFPIVRNKRQSIDNRRRCDPGVSGRHWMPFGRPNLRPLPADRVVGVDDCKLRSQEPFHFISLFDAPIGETHASFYFGAGHKRDEQSAFSHVLPIRNAELAVIENEGDDIGID